MPIKISMLDDFKKIPYTHKMPYNYTKYSSQLTKRDLFDGYWIIEIKSSTYIPFRILILKIYMIIAQNRTQKTTVLQGV